MKILHVIAEFVGTKTDGAIDDDNVHGVYAVEVNEDLNSKNAASVALDIFHSNIAVDTLDDFEFTVKYRGRTLSENPDHKTYSGEALGGDVWKTSDIIRPEADAYFIVLDQAPIKGSPTSKYDLMHGDYINAIGVEQASAATLKELLSKVPGGEDVYRTYIERTDGRTGYKKINRSPKPSPSVDLQ